MTEHVQADLEDPYKFRVAAEIADLLSFYETGSGTPRDIVREMRIVIEIYCTATYPDHFDAEDTLRSIVAKIRWSSENPKYMGNGVVQMEQAEDWKLPAQSAVLLEPVEAKPDARDIRIYLEAQRVK